MNRNVCVLLTAAILASVLNMARAETMEERKQRIMRKYMRERQDIMQSDFGVPEAGVDDEDVRVAESEQFKDIEPDFERHKGGVEPPPMARPVPVQQAEQNWWLETTEMEEDSFADPVSSQGDFGERAADSWSLWDRRDDSSAYGDFGRQREREKETYTDRREDTSIYGAAAGGQWGERDAAYPGRSAGYGKQDEYGDRSSVSGMSYDDYTTGRARTLRANDQLPGYYGRQQMDARRSDAGWELDSSGRYNPSRSQGWPRSSLPPPTDTRGWGAQSQTPEYTPYRSPYQTQGDEQRRYGDTFQPQEPQYSRPNNYQKWKDSDKAWDPTAGNPYLDELMRNERR